MFGSKVGAGMLHKGVGSGSGVGSISPLPVESVPHVGGLPGTGNIARTPPRMSTPGGHPATRDAWALIRKIHGAGKRTSVAPSPRSEPLGGVGINAEARIAAPRDESPLMKIRGARVRPPKEQGPKILQTGGEYGG